MLFSLIFRISFLFAATTSQFNVVKNTKLACLEMFPQCICPIQSSIYCSNIDSFDDLNFIQVANRTFDYISIVPNKKSLLNNQTLNLGDTKISASGTVLLGNVESFDITCNPFRDSKPDGVSQFNKLFIENSNINFILLYNSCSKDTQFSQPLFANFKSIYFKNDNAYSTNTCPFIFQNGDYDHIEISGLSEINRLEFFQFQGSLDSLNIITSTTVRRLDIINSPRVSLTSRLLDQYLFYKIESLAIKNTYIDEIEDTLFLGKFDSLCAISLELTDFKDFFKPNKMEWMKYLNGGNCQLIVGFTVCI